MLNYMGENEVMKACGMVSSCKNLRLLTLTSNQVQYINQQQNQSTINNLSKFGKPFTNLDRSKLNNLVKKVSELECPIILNHVTDMQAYGKSIELDEIDPSLFGLNRRSLAEFIQSCINGYSSEIAADNVDDVNDTNNIADIHIHNNGHHNNTVAEDELLILS